MRARLAQYLNQGCAKTTAETSYFKGKEAASRGGQEMGNLPPSRSVKPRIGQIVYAANQHTNCQFQQARRTVVDNPLTGRMIPTVPNRKSR